MWSTRRANVPRAILPDLFLGPSRESLEEMQIDGIQGCQSELLCLHAVNNLPSSTAPEAMGRKGTRQGNSEAERSCVVTLPGLHRISLATPAGLEATEALLPAEG